MVRHVAGIVLASVACDPAGYPPVARVVVTPEAIIENDGFQTPVTLDATESADPIDDPSGESPLVYSWDLIGDEHNYERGRSSSSAPVVRFRGDRPATIVLTVTDRDGAQSTATAHLKLTVR
jgi:hypothetical protein